MKKMLELVRRGFEVEYNGYKITYNKFANVYIAQGNGKIIQRGCADIFAKLITD